MKNEKIKLNDLYNVQGGELTVYAMDLPFDNANVSWQRPAIVVVPGGGYAMVSKREWEPVATEFFARGYQVFVLNYLCTPVACYPEQLLEIACSVDFIRKNAEKYNVNASQVFAVGFSAGGHLVGNLSVNNGAVEKYYNGKLDCKLTASCLAYPVISAEYGHCGSHNNLFCGKPTDQLISETNLDKQVNANTCPSFIWSTAEDSCVPCQNAIYYALALKQQGIAFELHIYPQGEHGLSTCSEEINPVTPLLQKNVKWLDDCNAFFKLFCNK